jgi:general secretion pathway protein A
MYERFYNLRERPFALSPDPAYLYPSRVHREALDYLRYGIESLAGFIVISGEIGSGKTTLLQSIIRSLDSGTTVARIVNTQLEPRELLETVMLDLGLDPAGKSKPVMLRDLAQHLVDERLGGRIVLLVIDEAQNLTLPAFEELRMLSNLETDKSKLIQIVMVGQPNLRDKLAQTELEQLRQRITVSYHLEPLDEGETEAYINHRLRRAALGPALEFPREVAKLVHARSRGVPRMINVICDATLVFGYAEEKRDIDRALIDEVLAELETTGILNQDAGHGFSRAGRADVLPRIAETDPAVLRDLQEREARLADRERVLERREQELAAQRRILAEEYRLLRSRTSRDHTDIETKPPTPPRAGGTHVTTPPAAAPPRPPAAMAFDAVRGPETFWMWLRRIFLGTPQPGYVDADWR